MKKRQQGILTIEASLVLTMFMFVVLFLLSFARVYRAQNLLSHATIQTADAVALESYLREMAHEGDEQEILYLANLINGDTTLSGTGLESLRSANLTQIARQKFSAAIAGTESEANQKLERAGVKDGLAGIDFSSSTADLVNDDIIITINCTLKMQFPIFGLEEIQITKSAKAKTFGEILFELTTESNNKNWGSTSGDNKVTQGTNVQITATPKYGYQFVGWNDGSTENPRTVTVNEQSKYTATFAPRDDFGMNLSVKILSVHGTSHSNFGAVEGEGNYVYQTNAQIRAWTTDSHYTFVGWDDNGSCSINKSGKVSGLESTEATRNIVMDKTYEITAVFVPKTYTVTVQSNNNSYGSASFQMTGAKYMEYKASFGIFASPKSGYRFSGWADDGSTDTIRQITVTGDKTYTANFASENYTVRFYSKGSLQATKTVKAGTKLGSNMPAIPINNIGYEFTGWRCEGKAFSGKTVINSDLDVNASWQQCKSHVWGDCGVVHNEYKWMSPPDHRASNELGVYNGSIKIVCIVCAKCGVQKTGANGAPFYWCHTHAIKNRRTVCECYKNAMNKYSFGTFPVHGNTDFINENSYRKSN